MHQKRTRGLQSFHHPRHEVIKPGLFLEINSKSKCAGSRIGGDKTLHRDIFLNKSIMARHSGWRSPCFVFRWFGLPFSRFRAEDADSPILFEFLVAHED